MSQPVVLFALISNGVKRFYVEGGAQIFLLRELVWGPEEFERWVSQLEETDNDYEEIAGGVIVDFDRKRLVWSDEEGHLKVPKVAALHHRLLQTAWPGYTIQRDPQISKQLAAESENSLIDQSVDENSALQSRSESVRDAAGLSGEEDADEDSDDGEPLDFGDEPRAWVTLIDSNGAVRHRQLTELPIALLCGYDNALTELHALAAAEVPAESVVTEGMWIDEKRRAIGLWGGSSTRQVLRNVETSWTGWTVRWADRGYAAQCEVSGPCGMPMSDTDALAQLMPTILSTTRFDLKNMMGAVGGQLKKTAIKAMGCLVAIICLPVLLFGAISGNWRAALITVGVICGAAFVVFKALEFRFRKSFQRSLSPVTEKYESDSERAPVAGPLDKQDRRARLDQLLSKAGFPPLKEIEPHFPEDNMLTMMG